MNNFKQRSHQEESMDGAVVSLPEYSRALRELAMINRLTLAHWPVLRALEKFLKSVPDGNTLSILDVAYGQGDLLRAIARWARRRGYQVELCGIDLNPKSAVEAKSLTPDSMKITYLTGDVFRYHPTQKPDIIVNSQFAHHLTDDGVVQFIKWLDMNSKIGWIILDLHRHPLAYRLFEGLALIGRFSRIVREDGKISIARGFSRQEWLSLLQLAGSSAKLTWQIPFRFLVTSSK